MQLNTWTGIGHVVADPQLNTTRSGKRWTKFTIVCKEFYKEEGSKLKQRPTFVDIVAWNQKAELICNYVKKGYEVLIQGRLKISFYNDPKYNGLRRKNVQIEATHCSWDSSKNRQGGVVNDEYMVEEGGKDE